MTRITKEELLEKIFNDDYEHLKGKKLRMTCSCSRQRSLSGSHHQYFPDPCLSESGIAYRCT